ncbi:MAG TPA: septum formation initiator family protein [Clostridia bacterium]|jgi:cell division protein FtsL|nr:septum formation initiator family protein [Clostridia bacterium]
MIQFYPEKYIVRKRRRRRKIPRYFKVMLSIILIYLLISFLVSGYQIYELKKEINQEKILTEKLLKQQEELEHELETLQDPEMIETLARENLGLVKPGEILIIPAFPGDKP